MRYLSIDIEATGLDEKDYIIEFAAVPFDTDKLEISDELSFHNYIKCPDFTSLKPHLSDWVINHNKSLIEKAHQSGLSLNEFGTSLRNYLNSSTIRQYFSDEKIVLFGKSLNAIDLPFLTRDLGWKFMRQYFSHRTHDLSSVAYSYIDEKRIPEECENGSLLMKHLGMGNVCHTALEDAINTAKMYLKLLKL